MIFTAIFLRASKNLSCGNVPDGGWKFKAEQEHCMRRQHTIVQVLDSG